MEISRTLASSYSLESIRLASSARVEKNTQENLKLLTKEEIKNGDVLKEQQQKEQQKTMVNTQGQVTGRIINIFA